MLRCIKNKASSVWKKRKEVSTTTSAESQTPATETETATNSATVDPPIDPPPTYQETTYPLPPVSVPSTISTVSEHENQPEHLQTLEQFVYPLPSMSVPSTVSSLSDYQPDRDQFVVHETMNEPPTPESPGPDPFTPRYVPYTDAAPLKNNMFSRNAGIYGRVNPDIMGGFGDDDESIWLVDDEETTEEQQHDNRSRPASTTDSSTQLSPSPSRSAFSHDAATQSQEPGLSAAPSSTQATFRYRQPSFLDNNDFTPGSRSDIIIACGTTHPPVARRGYAPVSASILNLTDFDVEDIGTKTSDDICETEPPHKRTKNTAAASSTSSSANPYVDLFEQQDDAMTMAYLRRLEQSENAAADDFRCPECRELLEYADIQRYANKQTFTKYETIALRAAMSEAENFVWCTSGCGSGQIHESGSAQPIVTCLYCNHRSCFHHNVAWHETLSCEEYDQLLADPDNFRSRLELENERWSEAQQAQLQADMAMAQGLFAEEQEMRRREERAHREREQAQKAAELARQIAARRKREEAKSNATVNRTTKPCGGCGWAIEKNRGCSHMTCVKCHYEFCWACNEKWSRGHPNYCRG
ncbi:hypothetical protein F53441_4685 [Fusarium austroafricanum]|uniref:RBR-type E3 ubiquitin transferase n=1 Tax=Fusarium austroafricanum TaxID=2364996 RepID=A0A8H4KLW2_9HYPO|nr:hypothetical protein F53441_4685 [Fusarium austroafricanum]